MSNEVAIRLENVSKRYHLRHPVTSDSGEETHELWALKDVSFEIKKGESVGIIGPNGSGKSTLLKILAGVTKPTSGKVEIFGRVASILDIGAGFHPELSGRENVFLNGQIHGFSKKEIQSKFDEIVAFSGIEKFIDEPVKNYSNGMYLRLAFSIMAHLDFDVYLFDEVFETGDDEFRLKSRTIFDSFYSKTALLAYHGSAPGILLEREIIIKSGVVQKDFNIKIIDQIIFNDLVDVEIFNSKLIFKFKSFTTEENHLYSFRLKDASGIYISDFIVPDFFNSEDKFEFDLRQIRSGIYTWEFVSIDLNVQSKVKFKKDIIGFTTKGFYIDEYLKNSNAICNLTLKKL